MQQSSGHVFGRLWTSGFRCRRTSISSPVWGTHPMSVSRLFSTTKLLRLDRLHLPRGAARTITGRSFCFTGWWRRNRRHPGQTLFFSFFASVGGGIAACVPHSLQSPWRIRPSCAVPTGFFPLRWPPLAQPNPTSCWRAPLIDRRRRSRSVPVFPDGPRICPRSCGRDRRG
jgi:hypothetical protein